MADHRTVRLLSCIQSYEGSSRITEHAMSQVVCDGEIFSYDVIFKIRRMGWNTKSILKGMYVL